MRKFARTFRDFLRGMPLPTKAEVPSTALYFEVHVTIDPPVDEEQRRSFELMAIGHGFKLAKLTLKSGATFVGDAFMTTRGADFIDVRFRTTQLVRDFRACGVKVRRYKLENTLVDSKTANGDAWNLLNG